MIDLTPEQKARATKAARDSAWHRKQIGRLEKLYQDAIDVGNREDADAIAKVIDMHLQGIEIARRILSDLGL